MVREIRRSGGEATANYDSVLDGHKVVQSCIDTYGKLDICIANAGILTPEPFADLGIAAFDRTLSINVTGVFAVVQAAWCVDSILRESTSRWCFASTLSRPLHLVRCCGGTEPAARTWCCLTRADIRVHCCFDGACKGRTLFTTSTGGLSC